MNNTIKILRIENKLTQEKLAKMIGISRPGLSDIENGKVIPSGKTIIRLANIFGIPAQNIFYEEQEEDKSNET